MVQQNDLIGIVLKRSPVGIHFHLRNQQALAAFRHPLRHLENNPQGRSKTFHTAMHLPAPNGLPFAGGRFLSFFLRNLQPLLNIFPTEVSLDQPVGSFLDADGDVVQTVIPRIQADQDLFVRDHLRIPDRFPQKRRRFLLRMLTPFPKLNIDLVSFPAKISKNRGISVNPLVGQRHPLLLRLGIVERTDVDIQGSQIALMGGYRSNVGRRLADQPRRLLPKDSVKGPLNHIQPLTKGRAGRTLLNPKAVTEKRNVAKRLNRIVVRLPHAQQSDHRFHDIAMGNLGFPASGQRHRVDTLLQFHPFHQGADQGQARVAGQMFVARFDDKFHRSHIHLPGVFPGIREYHKCPVM